MLSMNSCKPPVPDAWNTTDEPLASSSSQSVSEESLRRSRTTSGMSPVGISGESTDVIAGEGCQDDCGRCLGAEAAEAGAGAVFWGPPKRSAPREEEEEEKEPEALEEGTEEEVGRASSS